MRAVGVDVCFQRLRTSVCVDVCVCVRALVGGLSIVVSSNFIFLGIALRTDQSGGAPLLFVAVVVVDVVGVSEPDDGRGSPTESLLALPFWNPKKKANKIYEKKNPYRIGKLMRKRSGSALNGAAANTQKKRPKKEAKQNAGRRRSQRVSETTATHQTNTARSER